MMTVEELYSRDTITRVKNREALQSAAKQFGMSMDSANEAVSKRALELAAINERKAFAA